jgi:hypothetical protein
MSEPLHTLHTRLGTQVIEVKHYRTMPNGVTWVLVVTVDPAQMFWTPVANLVTVSNT